MRTITRDDLHARAAAGDVTIDEALAPAPFAAAHLPGALNLPYDQVEQLAPALLPDRVASIVVYCRRRGQVGLGRRRVGRRARNGRYPHGLMTTSGHA